LVREEAEIMRMKLNVFAGAVMLFLLSQSGATQQPAAIQEETESNTSQSSPSIR